MEAGTGLETEEADNSESEELPGKGSENRTVGNEVTAEGDHQQQEPAVNPERAMARIGTEDEMKESADSAAQVEAGAALAEREQFASGRPGMVRALGTNEPKDGLKEFRHQLLAFLLFSRR
jgi:hypothetical protein